MSAAMAVGAVPLSLRAGMWVGTLGSSTVLAALPALLLFVVLPPLAVVGAHAWSRHRRGAGSVRWGSAVGVALGLQVLVLVGAIWAGASARRLGDVALLTVVEVAVLPAAVMAWMQRSDRTPASSAGRERA